MNLRRKTPHDSLYLLLDTLCNAFGGIILLAVLVVLLTSKEKTQRDTSADSQEMLQRRLAMAQTNLQLSLQLEASLQDKANDPRWKQQMTLLSTRKELQDVVRQSHDTATHDAKELDSANASDPAERLKFLNSELAAAQLHRLEESNGLATLDNDIKRLSQRLADMGQQVTNKEKDLQRPLRMPREHDTSKAVLYVIVRYGRLYPLSDLNFVHNVIDVHWTTNDFKETAEPIQSKGFDPVQNPGAANAYFNSVPRDSYYVVFCVVSDSFPTFIRGKEYAIEHGISYSWLPYRLEDPVAFAAFGTIPRPQ